MGVRSILERRGAQRFDRFFRRCVVAPSLLTELDRPGVHGATHGQEGHLFVAQ
jgi:hypothetical protein